MHHTWKIITIFLLWLNLNRGGYFLYRCPTCLDYNTFYFKHPYNIIKLKMVEAASDQFKCISMQDVFEYFNAKPVSGYVLYIFRRMKFSFNKTHPKPNLLSSLNNMSPLDSHVFSRDYQFLFISLCCLTRVYSSM